MRLNPDFIHQMLVDGMRVRGQNLDEAARAVVLGMGLSDRSEVDEVVEAIRKKGRDYQTLTNPSGMHSSEYMADLRGEAGIHSWYTGPREGDRWWPQVSAVLSRAGDDVVQSVDKASSTVVAHLSPPNVRELKKKGLVVGYVQSGKTANYTAVMAKAADAGYRLFIVLSGLHNNLRKQTQARLEADLFDDDWVRLTSMSADFGSVVGGSALLNANKPIVAVVKKNGTRLAKLRDWLRDVPREIRARCPVLILDDEADQATPNSESFAKARSAINRLLGEIWEEVPSGTYLGYTATPFANVFMDPDLEADFYPKNFIIDLPRADAYFGAERVFGRQAVDDADQPEDGLDMVRHVPMDDEAALTPTGTQADREAFDPELPRSLEEAIDWFLLATAIRRARGQLAHSSMLIHTTHYVAPHFAMRDRVRHHLKLADPADPRFEALFNAEAGRVAGERTSPMPSWAAVEAWLPGVIESTRVVADNGRSEERLDYDQTDAAGQPIPLTVIAIGGATLSRGLTLEGLVVSFFTRSSNTYDTLLQMGRWFGYRVGYEDLPRIWMPEGLAQDFRFLALVEEEIRRDMRSMEKAGITPDEYGVRVRSHPGRLEITAKRGVSRPVRVSFAGQRRQTFILEEHDEATLRVNLEATRRLIRDRIGAARFRTGEVGKARWIAEDVSAAVVADFIREYSFHPSQPSLSSELVAGWILRSAPQIPWNVVIAGSSTAKLDDSRNLDLGLGAAIPPVNRAPLAQPSNGTANIKALLSARDWTADLAMEHVQPLLGEKPDYEAARWALTGHGLLLVYPIDRGSVPMGAALKLHTRRDMQAPVDLIGLGLVFPRPDGEADAYEATYYSVHPDWSKPVEDDYDVPVDTEDSLDLRIGDLPVSAL